MSKPIDQLTPQQQARRAEAIRQAAEALSRMTRPAKK